MGTINGPLKLSYEAGKEPRGQVLPPGRSNGFPEYRFGTDRITSLQRRLRTCFVSFPFVPRRLISAQRSGLTLKSTCMPAVTAWRSKPRRNAINTVVAQDDKITVTIDLNVRDC